MKKDNDLFKLIKKYSKDSAENLFFKLVLEKNEIDKIVNILNNISIDYSLCAKCNYIKEKGTCFFCDDKNRDKTLICVVSSLYDGFKIYNTNYNGLIHVINDISITKDNKTIKALKERLYNINELIIALNLTFEGELLSNYLKLKLNKYVKKVSRIAQGIPFGGSLNYADYETLTISLLNRKGYK